MHPVRCRMRPEDAPPGFPLGPPDAAADADLHVEGVCLESVVPTRFFQQLDRYPREWGRLTWRVQLNALDGDRAAAPSFRTFYPGVEWNLRRGPQRWLLTGWLHWEGPGPQEQRDGSPCRPELDGDTVLFRFGTLPGGSPLYLRSRVDARDRRSIAAALRAEPETPAPDSSVIVLDDVLGPR